MQVLRTYSNVKNSLDIVNRRIEYLIDKKKKIHSEFFPITTHMKEIVVSGNSKKKTFTDYMIKLNEVDPATGMSLPEELGYQFKEKQQLEKELNYMTEKIIELQGIEFEIYKQVIINGKKPTEAVAITAKASKLTEQTIWKNYYPNVKEILNIH